MSSIKPLFSLNVDGSGIFDASTSAIPVAAVGEPISTDESATLELPIDSHIVVDRDEALDTLSAFTIEATITPATIDQAQTILSSQSPPVRIVIASDGHLEAAVHTEQGWQEIVGSEPLKEGQREDIRLIRNDSGLLQLQVNGNTIAERETDSTITSTGTAGITLGSDLDGTDGFVGRIGHVHIFDGVLRATTIEEIALREARLSQELTTRYHFPVQVFTQRGSVDKSFNNIKAIMQSVGVESLDQLSTLQIDQSTTLTPGSVLLAPRATHTNPAPQANWYEIATNFQRVVSVDNIKAQKLLNEHLLSRSIAVELAQPFHERATVIPSQELRLATDTISELRPSFPYQLEISPTVQPIVDFEMPQLEAVTVLNRLEPEKWPVMSQQPSAITADTIPVNSSVIVAKKLDLTNKTLLLEPHVSTLYIIAEEIRADKGAKISWRRPSMGIPYTPSDPSNHGHSWSGTHTAQNSRRGLSGGDAKPGKKGLPGFNGSDAPSIEIWAKKFVGMPDIDLRGQKGGTGGTGQPGGNGGRGARGENGKWVWFFGEHCWEEPGDGGDGGDGAPGGSGGNGGNGGDAGQILLAVLEETLGELTTTNAFTPQVDGGQPGAGGRGGQGGSGGRGGAHGASQLEDREICTGGRAGRRGQDGARGNEGRSGQAGANRKIRIMTVTQESWDEQLTRPWLYEVTPKAVFPDERIIVKGARFADTDRIVMGSDVLVPTLRADGAMEVRSPKNIVGGKYPLFVRRHDGKESNRLEIAIRPQLLGNAPTLRPRSQITLQGRAFKSGATVNFGNAGSLSAKAVSATELTFDNIGASSGVDLEGQIEISVTNPDGYSSNILKAQKPGTLSNGFQIGTHDYYFDNFSDGIPSWATYEETFGALEVYRELLDPLFGHPILVAAFYLFYVHFLKGSENGGAATGFCTSLASVALDQYWQGDNSARTVHKDDIHARLTAVHGRLLSRENLITMHDQSRQGTKNVLTTFRKIEENFRSGGSRETAPLLFFVPSGAVWDAGYIDALSRSHCIVPIEIVYPLGYSASKDPAGTKMYCWDNNYPGDKNCYVELVRVGDELHFKYFVKGENSPTFQTSDRVTLGTQSLGEYLLRDVDMPFSGPLGLTTFVVDFLLSPATLSITDGLGHTTGQVGGQILSEIPGSHPAYMVPGMYMLPANAGLTRTIKGTAEGSYGFNSISPNGVSISFDNIDTHVSEVDTLAINADASRFRFVPGAQKTVNMTLGSRSTDFARGIKIDGFEASPLADLDVTVAPNLSVIKIENHGNNVNLKVRCIGLDLATKEENVFDRGVVQVPANHDLVLTVTDWHNLGEDVVGAATLRQEI